MRVKKHTWQVYALWIVCTEAVGALSGWLARSGIRLYAQAAVQPPLSPPPWVFPVVWTVLYALMGIGAARVWLSAPSRPRAAGVRLYLAQLAFNFCWPLLFFSLGAYGLALAWLLALWALIWGMLLAFRRADPPSGWMQVPYLLWTAFAAYLNWGAWRLN